MKQSKQFRLSVLPAVAFALLLMCLFQSSSVGAASVSQNVHTMGTRQHHTNAPTTNNLIYHTGGMVIAGGAQIYTIFWEPSNCYVNPSYNSLINRYFVDVGGSALYANNRQYSGSNWPYIPDSAVLKGTWTDTAPYPANPLSDAQVQMEVIHAQIMNSKKGWAISSMYNIFFVFTCRGENICISQGICSFTNFCGYHSYLGLGEIYAAMPYAGTRLSACGIPGNVSPNSNIDADSEISIASHEQMEAATDPMLDAWFDSSNPPQEIGDKCAWNFGNVNLDGGKANVQWNGHFYIVQQEWDNAKSSCVLSGP